MAAGTVLSFVANNSGNDHLVVTSDPGAFGTAR